MEVSAQFHALTALTPGKYYTVPKTLGHNRVLHNRLVSDIYL
jgi:hypothetical protein